MFKVIKENNIILKEFNLGDTNLTLKLNKKEINIYDQNYIDSYYLKEIQTLIKDIAKKIIILLSEDDPDDEKILSLYDELKSLTKSIQKKYDNKLSKYAKLNYMKNIRFLAHEIKKYNKKNMYNINSRVR